MKRSTEKNSSTEGAFLDAAERLFAEHGYEGTRVRAIAEASNANLGALHYYWGSKEALFAAVWSRRTRPLIEYRRKMVEEIEARPATDTIAIEELVTGWIEAGLGYAAIDGEPSAAFQQLYGRAITDPSPEVRVVVQEYLDETGLILIRLLRRACPQLSETEIYWRMHGLLGTVLYAHIGRQGLDGEKLGLKIEGDMRRGARELVHFVIAGFKAPSLDK